MRYALLLISFLPAIVRAAPLHGFVSVLPIKTCATIQYPMIPHRARSARLRRLSCMSAPEYPSRLPGWIDRIHSANHKMAILDARSGIEMRDMEAPDRDD